ncbi:MAG: HicB family protein [Firmicutes bacterium]|nr:HicB family protein [Bacillota bacterium]
MSKAVVYPVFIRETGGFYAVRIPDFDQFTEGRDLADAVVMARDTIGMMGVYLEDEGKDIPEPFSAGAAPEDGELSTLVDIDFTAYRKLHDNRLVKKNCTIPFYLEDAASRQGLNFSRILSEALAERLGLPLNV